MTASSLRLALVLAASLLAATACNAKAGTAAPVPAPTVDAPRASAPSKQTAVIAGGNGQSLVFESSKAALYFTP